MDTLHLDNKRSLSVELYKRKLRFIVYDNKSEFVCRIEAINVIEQFLQMKEANIFKGRLQLHKINGKINVEAKGNKIGSVTIQQLQKLIASCK